MGSPLASVTSGAPPYRRSSRAKRTRPAQPIKSRRTAPLEMIPAFSHTPDGARTTVLPTLTGGRQAVALVAIGERFGIGGSARAVDVRQVRQVRRLYAVDRRAAAGGVDRLRGLNRIGVLFGELGPRRGIT